jgi:Spy/CpxP family protein refolding chaperone
MMGMGMMGMMGRPATAIDLPVPLLVKALKLSDDQKSQIQDIHKQLDDTRAQMMTPPDPNNPPDPQNMRAMFTKMMEMQQKANNQIVNLLSPTQKKTLAKLLKEQNDYRTVGIPPEAVPGLNLTSEQRQKIANIAEKAQKAQKDAMPQNNNGNNQRPDWQALGQIMRNAHQDALAVLTDSQRAKLQEFMQKNMRPGMGGPGMRGPGMGGPGGPGGFGGQGGPPPAMAPGGPGGPQQMDPNVPDDPGGPGAPPQMDPNAPDGPALPE